jgi:hypothetical protein
MRIKHSLVIKILNKTEFKIIDKNNNTLIHLSKF